MVMRSKEIYYGINMAAKRHALYELVSTATKQIEAAAEKT
jgi:hypothetical protein